MPLVISSTKKPLMPCTPKRARLLLGRKKAAVFRTYPFTIILKERTDGETQPIEFKVDPGSKTTGIALVLHGKKEKKVVLSVNLQHRGHTIKSKLDARRGIRRSRRNRHTRYRKARFNNRTRCKGWLPPSLMSRVYNVTTWIKRFLKFSPISFCAVETVRFDMQKMITPEITGIYTGKVAVRSSGFFNISTSKETVQGISYKFCKKVHSMDGYSYANSK